jgi:O-antigen ligase
MWEMVWVRVLAHLQVFGIEIYSQSPFAVASVSSRLTRAQEGLQVWWNHPFLGVGINNFGRFFSQGVVPRIHGALLQSLAEMGIPGGVAFLALAFSSPIALLCKWRRMAEWEQSLYAGVGLGLLGRAVWMILAGNYILEFFWLDMVLATLLLSYGSQIGDRR